MVGIVLVTHGNLGAELIRTAEGIVGPFPGVQVVTIEAKDSMELIRKKLEKAIAAEDQGDGVLVLTDMFGGTPANLALSFLDEHRVEVVTGVNLPMLLKLGTSREDPATVGEVAHTITGYGQKNIVLASELLGARREAVPS